MKRSAINQKIKEAIIFFEEMNFKLPPWGYWTIEQWKEHKENCNEIFKNGRYHQQGRRKPDDTALSFK